ncbi:MAG: RNA 2',3'-cyclic phosphodiesterase [Bacteroidales bacterium]|nr:RNA 2',3'-cyclic phosphodiesterase [Bacteroidales bacterium]
MKRLFVAIKINPEDLLRCAFRKMKGDLATDQIKWVNEDNLHITLKFLGDTPDKDVSPIIQIIRKSLKDSESFHISIRGFGYFGNSRFPRVLWLDIDDGGQLQKLYTQINKGLRNFGPAEKSNVFKPHLTIGRVKEFRSINKLLELEAEFAGETFQTAPVNEIILYESFLKPGGPVYKVVEKFELF